MVLVLGPAGCRHSTDDLEHRIVSSLDVESVWHVFADQAVRFHGGHPWYNNSARVLGKALLLTSVHIKNEGVWVVKAITCIYKMSHVLFVCAAAASAVQEECDAVIIFIS